MIWSKYNKTKLVHGCHYEEDMDKLMQFGQFRELFMNVWDLLKATNADEVFLLMSVQIHKICLD